MCNFSHSVQFYTQCVILHAVCNFTYSVQDFQASKCLSEEKKLIIIFSTSAVSKSQLFQLLNGFSWNIWQVVHLKEFTFWSVIGGILGHNSVNMELWCIFNTPNCITTLFKWTMHEERKMRICLKFADSYNTNMTKWATWSDPLRESVHIKKVTKLWTFSVAPLAPHPPSTDTKGVFYRYIGRFELKFAALSLFQSYFNRPYNGEKHPQKLWNGGM